MPQIMQQEPGGDVFEAMSAEDIDAVLKARNLPPLQQIFRLPKRIDLEDPPAIDVTPTETPTKQ
jgi:hypothetical protein